MEFCQRYSGHFVQQGMNSVGHARHYLSGLLGTQRRKNIETIHNDVAQSDYQGMEQFLSSSPWCHRDLMDNHFHLLLEVPPMAETGLSDEMLLKRLSALDGEVFVAGVAKELADAKASVYTSEGGMDEAVAAIHKRFIYRMQDLGEFMKGLLQRFSQWFNRAHSRSGTLWEDRFKSVIVEDGVAARTLAAYIDLNPVRAGMVNDTADYRWSSYGEAIGGGAKGNGKTARAGLVRALKAHQGVGADADLWSSGVSREYRKLLMAGAVGKTSESVSRDGKPVTKTLRKGISKEEVEFERERDGEIPFGKMLRCRVRYFTDGAVIGSKEFVNEAFASARERFGQKRKDGARKMRGEASVAAGMLWSFRDLRKGICKTVLLLLGRGSLLGYQYRNLIDRLRAIGQTLSLKIVVPPDQFRFPDKMKRTFKDV